MQTRTVYLQQLDDLENSLDAMANAVAEGVRASSNVFAWAAAPADGWDGEVVPRFRSEIESVCLDIMLMQQPLVAGDLRFVTGAFRIVSDLSHIGEKLTSVTTLAKRVPAGELAGVAADLDAAAENVADMIAAAVGAFRAADMEAANRVFAMDDAVDAAYERVQQKVVALIRGSETDAEYLPELLMIAKYYERMGDDAQRIAAWAVFRVTGEHATGESPMACRAAGEHAIESVDN